MKSFNPTSPSRRQMSVSDYGRLSRVEPWRPLLKKLHSHAGRNSAGKITTRHQGGGNKKQYRDIDFLGMQRDVPGRVETIEYDPYRTAFIARVLFKNGARTYILAPEHLKVGDEIMNGAQAPLREGSRLPLKNIPVGHQVHNIELMPGRGGQLARSAGSYAEVMAHENGFSNLKLSSGEVRQVSWEGFASLGQVSNAEHNLITIGKAGRSRWLGIRPTVRGTAMNPVDHPYGGGEGRQPRGTRRPKTKWGKVTGGRKTRKRYKKSSRYILERRKK